MSDMNRITAAEKSATEHEVAMQDAMRRAQERTGNQVIEERVSPDGVRFQLVPFVELIPEDFGMVDDGDTRKAIEDAPWPASSEDGTYTLSAIADAIETVNQYLHADACNYERDMIGWTLNHCVTALRLQHTGRREHFAEALSEINHLPYAKQIKLLTALVAAMRKVA